MVSTQVPKKIEPWPASGCRSRPSSSKGFLLDSNGKVLLWPRKTRSMSMSHGLRHCAMIQQNGSSWSYPRVSRLHWLTVCFRELTRGFLKQDRSRDVVSGSVSSSTRGLPGSHIILEGRSTVQDTSNIWVPGVHGNLLYHLVMTNIAMV